MKLKPTEEFNGYKEPAVLYKYCEYKNVCAMSCFDSLFLDIVGH